MQIVKTGYSLMKSKKLIQEQLDKKIIKFRGLQDVVVPPRGWIYSIRQGINMSLRQLGQRMSITPQSVMEIEERESNGTVSIRVLKQVAAALEMDLVYGFVPREGSLHAMVERRSKELATCIVEKTAVHMTLENQKTTDERLQNDIKERTDEIKRGLPRYLWDLNWNI